MPDRQMVIFAAVCIFIAGASVGVAAYLGLMWVYAHVVVVL